MQCKLAAATNSYTSYLGTVLVLSIKVTGQQVYMTFENLLKHLAPCCQWSKAREG